MKRNLFVLAMILWGGMVTAQHSHGVSKGPNGGKMQDVAGVHVELVVAGNTVTINAFDEDNKPVGTMWDIQRRSR
jgi:hypothetical protein